MKPVKIRMLEIVEYWSCCVPYHRHTTESVAIECNSKRKDTPVVTQKERSMIAKFNAIEALSLFLELESFKLVGVAIELSVTSAIGKVSRGARMLGVYEHKKEAILSKKTELIVAIDDWKLRQINLNNILDKRR